MSEDEARKIATVPDEEEAEKEPADAPPEEQRPQRRLAMLCLMALGVVFGDIGTSPLYALRECFRGERMTVAVHQATVLGVLSLILWSLIIVISIKYLVYVLRADNRGEGGILALMSLLNLRRKGRSKFVNRALLVCGLFGAALLYGDGMITPAISVLSAVEGLKIATPVFEHYVIPITVAILIGLFVFQRHGSGRVGLVFGPVVLVWMLTLAVLGIFGIMRQPEVLRAVNPYWAGRFLLMDGGRGFIVLGAVFLVVTGGEALYADIGHFGKLPIRLVWFGIMLPALLLNYFGQGALVLGNAEFIVNPFYHLAPSWALYPMVVLATAATIIASQAIISGVFSLTRQAVLLDEFPRVRIVQTSQTEIGQIYVPVINWTLMVATIGLVLGFGSSSGLAGAYGVAISMTMVLTTIIAAFVAVRLWKWNVWVVVVISAALLVVDLAFLGSNMLKFVEGGWFPLLVGGVFFFAMVTWQRGRRLLAIRTAKLSVSPEQFFEMMRDDPPRRIDGTGVFMTGSVNDIPAVLVHHFRHNHVLHELVIVLTVEIDDVPHLPARERVSVEQLGEGLVRVVIHFGFMDEPNVPRALRRGRSAEFDFDPDSVTYYIGRQTVLPTDKVKGMSVWRERFFVRMMRNATLPTTFFHLPPERVLEVGYRVEI